MNYFKGFGYEFHNTLYTLSLSNNSSFIHIRKQWFWAQLIELILITQLIKR